MPPETKMAPSNATSIPVPHDDTPSTTLMPIKIENESDSTDEIDLSIKADPDDMQATDSAAQRRAERRCKMRRTTSRATAAKPVALSSPSDTSDSSSDEASRRKLEKEVEREKKLQARKIRNRLSAALSRKRKADRIEELEGQVAFLMQENSRLRGMVTASLNYSLPPPKLPTLSTKGVSSFYGANPASFDSQCTNNSGIPAAYALQ